MAKIKIGAILKIIFIFVIILVVLFIVGVLSSNPKDNNSSSNTVSSSDASNTNKPVVGVEVENQGNPVDDFFYSLTDGTIMLESCNTHKSTLTIYPTYTVDGKEYTTDLSNFQIGIGNSSIDTLILSEGITEVKTSIFNSCDIQKVYFPKSMVNVYDYTLSYLRPKKDTDRIKIYYGGTQDEWSNIFTEYKRTKVEDAEFGYELGEALADKANEVIGSKYDSSLFEYYFSANPDDL